MNANEIISETMSLEEKLAAIDAAMKNAQAEAGQSNGLDAPVDPQSFLMCEGCQ